MKNLLFLAAIAFMMTGCFAPINSVYDSAALLEEGEVQVKGNYSQYNEFEEDSIGVKLNKNIGGSIAYGLTNETMLGFRYEKITNQNSPRQFEGLEGIESFNYFEFRSKMKIYKDAVSLEIPASIYFLKKDVASYAVHPRLYLTYRANQFFEITAVPNINFIIGHHASTFPIGGSINPGIIANVGLSTNLDKWAIRPEIGYDGYLNVGIGVNYNFQLRKK